jgi:hypothetical protein
VAVEALDPTPEERLSILSSRAFGPRNLMKIGQS